MPSRQYNLPCLEKHNLMLLGPLHSTTAATQLLTPPQRVLSTRAASHRHIKITTGWVVCQPACYLTHRVTQQRVCRAAQDSSTPRSGGGGSGGQPPTSSNKPTAADDSDGQGNSGPVTPASAWPRWYKASHLLDIVTSVPEAVTAAVPCATSAAVHAVVGASGQVGWSAVLTPIRAALLVCAGVDLGDGLGLPGVEVQVAAGQAPRS
jgi:hypothetical protein